jgi:hypothetical protein
MENPIPVSRALADSAHDSMVAFLKIELQIANTMLDAAATTHDAETRERRRGRANEACAEVVRYLDPEVGRSVLSADEREDLSMELRAVQGRMAT